MRRPRFERLLALCFALLATCVACPAMAQVRNAPAGNSLPEETHTGHEVGEDGHAHDERPAAVSLSDDAHEAFARSIDLDTIRKLPVFDGGRVKIIDTLAREQINRVYGKERFKDLETEAKYDPVFTYLDLMFNMGYYADKPLIHVEVLDLRRALLSDLSVDEQEMWLKRGRLTPRMILAPRSLEILQGMDGDILRQKAAGQVSTAWSSFVNGSRSLNLISPGEGTDQWANIVEYSQHADHLHDTSHEHIAVASPQAAEQAAKSWNELRAAWEKADAVSVNLAIEKLADALPRINPASYPPAWKSSAEILYNSTQKFTIGYIAYFFGAIMLLIAFSAPRRWLIIGGVSMLLVGFAIHSGGMLVRGLLSGRWPIHSQYESFIAIIWLGALVGIILTLTTRKWLFGAAAASMGAAALLFANTVEIPSNEVGQVAGILATSRILYVHVNMVLASYGLIALGFFISLIYLGVHYMRTAGSAKFAAAGLGQIDMDVDSNDNAPASVPGKQAVLNDLDRAQMVIIQLAFWILGTGILLGAYWADHSWGRWWAWDPKETWALLTWIIYLMVIHLRFAVKRRGLVTAWMSVVGFFVMLWCYWGVNLFLAGLHSYA